jgi:hypothetical protein
MEIKIKSISMVNDLLRNTSLKSQPKTGEEQKIKQPFTEEEEDQKLLVEKQLEQIDEMQGMRDLQTLSEATRFSKIHHNAPKPRIELSNEVIKEMSGNE